MHELQLNLSRRAALAGMSLGLGNFALNVLSGSPQKQPTSNPLAPKNPHFAPRAKNVILLFSSGGVSQLDLFDPKPVLSKNHGQMVPEEFVKGQRFAFINPKSKLLGTPYKLKEHGQSGMVFAATSCEGCG